MESSSISPIEQTPAEVHRRVTQFVEDLKEAERIYGGLIELVEKQDLALQSGDTAELVEIASLKEDQISRLDLVETRMSQTRKIWDTIQSSLSDNEKRFVQDAVSRVEKILRVLLELEEKQRQAILSQKEEALENIRRIEAGKKVSRAYNLPGPEVRGLLDQTE